MPNDNISPETRKWLLDFAKRKRDEPTEAEALLWRKLRGKKLGGFKFRRQHVIETYIVDFFCHATQVVVEVDGPIHEYHQEYDEVREGDLIAMGYRVLRFSNEEVLEDMEIVLAGIYDACMRRCE